MAKRKRQKDDVNLDFTLKVGKRSFLFRENVDLRDEIWGEAGEGIADFHPKLRDRSPRFQAEWIMHEALHLLEPRWSEARVRKIAHFLSRILRKAKLV